MNSTGLQRFLLKPTESHWPRMSHTEPFWSALIPCWAPLTHNDPLATVTPIWHQITLNNPISFPNCPKGPWIIWNYHERPQPPPRRQPIVTYDPSPTSQASIHPQWALNTLQKIEGVSTWITKKKSNYMKAKFPWKLTVVIMVLNAEKRSSLIWNLLRQYCARHLQQRDENAVGRWHQKSSVSDKTQSVI